MGNRVEYIHDDLADNTQDKTVTYTYDDNDRLLTEKRDVNGMANDRFLVYSYDETVQTGKTVHSGLDATGTVLETTTNTYNLQGRLKEVDFDPDGATGSAAHKITKYEYDDSGIRVLKDVDGTVTRYLADANNHTGYTQVLEETDAAGNLQKSFLLGHDVIAQFDTTDGLVYLIYDGHGSTRQLLNSSGTVVTANSIAQVFTYSAYGELLGLEESQASTALLYSGEWFDVEVGWQYNRARWYEPANGRWNRLDDFAGRIHDPLSLHKYLYVHGDPIGGIDPSGLLTLTEIQVAATNLQINVATKVGAVFAAGGAALGRFFNALGLHAQRFAEQVIRLFPQIDTLSKNTQIINSTRRLDFLLQAGEKVAQLEVKYSIPIRAGEALNRLAAQINAMVASGQGQVFVWSLRPTNAAQLRRLQEAVGTQNFNKVQFAEGIEGLYQALKLYFGL